MTRLPLVEKTENAKYLTHDQWKAVMYIAPMPHERIVLRMPRWAGDSAKLVRGGRRCQIEPDGKIKEDR